MGQMEELGNGNGYSVEKLPTFYIQKPQKLSVGRHFREVLNVNAISPSTNVYVFNPNVGRAGKELFRIRYEPSLSHARRLRTSKLFLRT